MKYNACRFIGAAAGLVILCGVLLANEPVPRPNILVFTVDDMDADSPGFAGCPLPDVTPNMDRLSKESVWFQQAHVPSSVCGPSRQSFCTGLHPHRNGSLGFLQVPPEVPSLSGELRKAGYYTASLGKNRDYDSFPWDYFPEVGGDKNWYGRRPQTFADGVRNSIQAARKQGKPFFIGCNTSDPHRPFPGSAEEKENVEKVRRKWPNAKDYPVVKPFCTAAEVPLPGYLVDLPDIREERAQYVTAVHRADETLGAVLDVLREEGVADNTIIVFFSDNGASFPNDKMMTFWQSTSTPLLVRWPGVKPGVNSKDLVSTMDVMPALLEAAGTPPVPGLDGHSLLPVLKGEAKSLRDSLFTSYNFIVPGLQCMPMRGLHTSRYTFIYNAWSDGKVPAQNCEPLNGLSWSAAKKAAATDEKIAAWVRRTTYRDRFELYDREKDPSCMYNLAGDSEYAEIFESLRKKMEAEMEQTHDPLIESFSGKGPVPASWKVFTNMDHQPRRL